MNTRILNSENLTAKLEPFDSFWEGPENIEQGYGKFFDFYKYNYLKNIPLDKNSNILVISCGPGYFVNLLFKEGYKNVLGTDSDKVKVQWAKNHGLNCCESRAIEFLQKSNDETYDVIFCEQEINHLTKTEIISFLELARTKLKIHGTLICHSLNGANPITGSEALAQNFDHYNSCTEYTLIQILGHCGFDEIRIFPLNLYVFWKNPANYILLAGTSLLHLIFRLFFIIYGKNNKLFTKKIAAVCKRQE